MLVNRERNSASVKIRDTVNLVTPLKSYYKKNIKRTTNFFKREKDINPYYSDKTLL